jgi:hypothetical protein
MEDGTRLEEVGHKGMSLGTVSWPLPVMAPLCFLSAMM